MIVRARERKESGCEEGGVVVERERKGGRKRGRRREKLRKSESEREKEGGTEGGREGKRERERERGKEGGRRRERGREGGRKRRGGGGKSTYNKKLLQQICSFRNHSGWLSQEPHRRLYV